MSISLHFVRLCILQFGLGLPLQQDAKIKAGSAGACPRHFDTMVECMPYILRSKNIFLVCIYSQNRSELRDLFIALDSYWVGEVPSPISSLAVHEYLYLGPPHIQ